MVRITDVTTSTIVFIGYVVPFAFEQGYTGANDVISVDCVDAITATKDIPYRSVEDGERHGVDVRAEEIVKQVCDNAGGGIITSVFYQNNFDPKKFTLDSKVAQAGFLQDEMTALDSLNAVCLFFGYTCSLVGSILFFYDEHSITHSEYRDATLIYSGYRLEAFIQEVDLSDYVIHEDISVSIERAYDSIRIKTTGSDISVLCPNILDDENIVNNTDGRGTEEIVVGDAGSSTGYESRVPRESSVVDFGQSVGGILTPWSSPTQVNVGSSGGWRNGAMLISAIANENYNAILP